MRERILCVNTKIKEGEEGARRASRQREGSERRTGR